jgi:propionyl-CoA synthetase
MSRTDDIINVSGVRLSTGAMEEVLSSHPSVAEVCCIGTRDALKGQIPVGFLVLKSHAKDTPEQVVKDCVALVREKIGPVASFKSAVVVDCLPKTRSGKILRATLAKMANGDAWITPATIENPSALDVAQRALETIGLPPTKN